MRYCAVAFFLLYVLTVWVSAQQSTSTPAGSAAGAQQSQPPTAEKHAGPEAPKPEPSGHDYSKESFVIVLKDSFGVDIRASLQNTFSQRWSTSPDF